jgi:molybdate transport system substrate-binding protein
MARVRSIALVLAVLAAACGGSGRSGEVVVSAASSLTDAFAEMGSAFEAANPGTDVVLNFGSSATLRDQIGGGAPVDVFAPADLTTLNEVGDLLGEPRVFATNRLAIAVPVGNPAGVQNLSDFERADLLLGVCVPVAPCGRLAVEAFAAAGVVPAIDSEEPNVRALLTKVAAGELDAGVVYATDTTAPEVEGISVAAGPETRYPIARVLGGPSPDAAEAFIAFVLSAEGQAILAEYGFGSP